MKQVDIAARIDHTLLRSDSTEKDIVKLCHEAVKHGFASVCVNPTYLCTAARLLHGTTILPTTVVGFPLGGAITEIKLQEILVAKAHGAREVDVVMNIGRAKSSDWDTVRRDIEAMVQTAQGCGLKIKVIIETSMLNEDEKQKAAEIIRAAGADYIKTSTGFFGGATVEDVRKLKQWGGPELKVKASGGIKTQEFTLELITAGADRIGTSSGVEILGV